MSDNQSENSDSWSVKLNEHGYLPATGAAQMQPRIEIPEDVALAMDIVNQRQAEVLTAETRLDDAKNALLLAKGRLNFVKEKPTWKKVLNVSTSTTLQGIYTLCMQSGYSYAVWNGRIYRTGQPGEGMLGTGMLEADIA